LSSFAQPKPTDESSRLSPFAVGEPYQNVGLTARIQTLVTHSPTHILNVQKSIPEARRWKVLLPSGTEKGVGTIEFSFAQVVQISQESGTRRQSTIVVSEKDSVGLWRLLSLVGFVPEKNKRWNGQETHQSDSEFQGFPKNISSGAS